MESQNSSTSDERIKVIFEAKKKSYDSVDDVDFKKNIEILKSQPEKVVYLSLSGNSYTLNFCQEISKFFPALVNLEEIDLNDMFVGKSKIDIPPALESMCNNLIGLTKLHSIDLSNNAISVAGAKAISNFLEKSPNLKVLHISNGGVGPEGSSIIANSLKKGKIPLEAISIGRNRLENPGAQALAEFLRENKAIKEVYVFQNVIRKDGMIPLIDSVIDKEIKTLDISDNFINEETVDKFCEFLQKNASVKNLNVSDCNIDVKSAKRVVKALENTPALLEKIGFNRNELYEHESATLFLDVLITKNPSIQRVDIKGNEFKKITKQYYVKKTEGKKFLSAFSSGESSEEEDLANAFGKIKLGNQKF